MHSALCLSRLIDALNDKVGRLLMWLILFMTLLSTGNALIRKFFDYSSNGLLEAQWYMFSAVFLLGGAHVLLHNEHIRIDLLASRYSPQTRAWIDIFGTLVFLLPTVTMVLWLALPGFLESFRLQEVSANPGGLLLWPAKLLIPAGFILLLLQAVSEIIKRIAFLLGRIDDPLEKHVQPTAEENLIADSDHEPDTVVSSAPDASGNVLIEATEKTSSKKIAVTYNFGASLDEAIEKFGAEVVFSGFRRTSVITAQGVMRRLAKAGKSDAEIQAAITNWKPGVQAERISDPVARLKSMFSSMSAEERQKIMAELMGS